MPKRVVSKTCPYCGGPGEITCMHNATDLCVRCPACKARWYSASGECPDCGNVSEYFSNSPCAKCYAARQNKKLIKRVV